MFLHFTDYIYLIASFVAWIVALLGIGQAISSCLKMQANFGIAAAFGSAVAALIAGICGFSSLFFHYSNIFVFLFLSTGIYAAFANRKILPKFSLSFPLGSPLIWLAIIFISFRFMVACIPNPHPDALWYNLTAARQWFIAGQIRLIPDSIASVQAGWWDYLILWANQIAGNDYSNHGALLVQVFSQLNNFCIGYLGAASLAVYIIRSSVKENLDYSWIVIALLACLCSDELFYSSVTAKNDWGVLLWFAAGSIVLINAQDSRQKKAALFLVGLSCASKFSYLYPAAGLLISIYLFKRSMFPRISDMPYLALPCLAIWFRNYSWTGNPLFPTMNGLFDSPLLGPTWQQGMQSYESSFANANPSQIFKHLAGFFPGTNLLTVFFITPLFFRRLRESVNLNILWTTCAISIVIFCLTSGNRSEPRLIGIIPFLVSLLAILSVKTLLDEKKVSIIKESYCKKIILVYLLIFPLLHFDNRLLTNIVTPANAILNAPGGLSAGCLEQQHSGSQKTLLLTDTRLYYFLPYNAVRLWDDPVLDRKVLNAASAEEMVALFRSEGIQYVVETLTVIDVFFNVLKANWFIDYARKYPEAVVCSREDEKLIDLSKLP